MLKFNQRIKLPVPKHCNSKPEVYAADIKKAISFYFLNNSFFRWPGKLITLAAKKSRGTVISTLRKHNYCGKITKHWQGGLQTCSSDLQLGCRKTHISY